MTSQVVKVTVYIDDANDNRPRFAEPLVTLSIIESATPGSTYVIPAAVDADSPQFAVQRYELDSVNDKFGLEVSQNIDGTQEVYRPASAKTVIRFMHIHVGSTRLSSRGNACDDGFGVYSRRKQP